MLHQNAFSYPEPLSHQALKIAIHDYWAKYEKSFEQELRTIKNHNQKWFETNLKEILKIKIINAPIKVSNEILYQVFVRNRDRTHPLSYRESFKNDEKGFLFRGYDYFLKWFGLLTKHISGLVLYGDIETLEKFKLLDKYQQLYKYCCFTGFEDWLENNDDVFYRTIVWEWFSRKAGYLFYKEGIEQNSKQTFGITVNISDDIYQINHEINDALRRGHGTKGVVLFPNRITVPEFLGVINDLVELRSRIDKDRYISVYYIQLNHIKPWMKRLWEKIKKW